MYTDSATVTYSLAQCPSWSPLSIERWQSHAEDATRGDLTLDRSRASWQAGDVGAVQVLELPKGLFTAGYKAVLHVHSVTEECEIQALISQIDPKTKTEKKARGPPPLPDSLCGWLACWL